jgi:hypothetical protein
MLFSVFSLVLCIFIHALLICSHALAEEMNNTGEGEKYKDTNDNDRYTSAADAATNPSLYPACHGLLLSEGSEPT